LVFAIDGNGNTIWLESAKQKRMIQKGWIQAGKFGMAGIPFSEFESTITKQCHLFTCILVGEGLLLLFAKLLFISLPTQKAKQTYHT
jgi:hypothetical protein